MRVTILICDDQAIAREGLKTILNTSADIDVVGTASNGEEAIDLIPKVNPMLVLMDLKMPGMNGIHTTRLIRQHYPHIPVVVLTTYADDAWVFDAIRSGAAGYLLKDSPREELVKAIHGTLHGRTHIDPLVAGKLFERISQEQDPPQESSQQESPLFEPLSEREKQVLQLLATGKTNREIAVALHLSEGTVRNYISAVCARLGVTDRTQAAITAIQHRLV